MGQCCTASERGHKQARKSLQVANPKCYQVHGFIHNQSVDFWSRKLSVDGSRPEVL